MLVPRLSPLNKVSVESICPRGVSWAESEFAFPPLYHSPVFSAESAAFAREVDYWIMNYRSFFIFQPSSEMCRYFSTYWGSKWKEKEKILLSPRERKKKKKKKPTTILPNRSISLPGMIVIIVLINSISNFGVISFLPWPDDNISGQWSEVSLDNTRQGHLVRSEKSLPSWQGVGGAGLGHSPEMRVPL